jgi:hypothetical protein
MAQGLRNVLIMHGFASAADAEKFLAGAELRDAMQRAGVQGQPRVEISADQPRRELARLNTRWQRSPWPDAR